MLSILSRAPPCPGKKFPVSFNKHFLFKNEKNISPAWQLIEVPNPIIILLNSKFFENNVKLIEKGVQYFDKKIENPKYFIWSNNFNNIYKIYDNKKFTFVNENLDKDPAYDLYLMSLCKHFILSPSSMHYWAAFLSENNNKICLSPPYIKNEIGYFWFSNNKDIKPKWWLDI